MDLSELDDLGVTVDEEDEAVSSIIAERKVAMRSIIAESKEAAQHGRGEPD